MKNMNKNLDSKIGNGNKIFKVLKGNIPPKKL